MTHDMTQEEKAYKEELNGNSEGSVPDRQQNDIGEWNKPKLKCWTTETEREVLTHQRGLRGCHWESCCVQVTILLWLISLWHHCWVSWVASEDQYLQLQPAESGPASTLPASSLQPDRDEYYKSTPRKYQCFSKYFLSCHLAIRNSIYLSNNVRNQPVTFGPDIPPVSWVGPFTGLISS